MSQHPQRRAFQSALWLNLPLSIASLGILGTSCVDDLSLTTPANDNVEEDNQFAQAAKNTNAANINVQSIDDLYRIGEQWLKERDLTASIDYEKNQPNFQQIQERRLQKLDPQLLEKLRNPQFDMLNDVRNQLDQRGASATEKNIDEQGAVALITWDDRDILVGAQQLVSAQRPRLQLLRDVYGSLNQTLADIAQSHGAEVIRVYENFPMIAVRLPSVESAEALADYHAIAHLDAESVVTTTLASSLPLIGQPDAVSKGITGAGVSVAVLDTGLDYTRAAFGSCSAVGSNGCRVVVARDFATEDNALDANGHGTNVSGIVAGVAPGANLLGLDVFRGDLAFANDVIAAIDFAISNQAQHNIVAMNLSLGGGKFTAQCGNDAYELPFQRARAAGIVPVVASGNNAFNNAIASPACAPSAVSVGAVYSRNVGGLNTAVCRDTTTSADKITCFSNSASFLTMLAPGAMISAAGLTMAGTSQAAPHVAGAVALLRSSAGFPSDTVAQTITRMTGNADTITDARNSVSKPRLNITRIVETLNGPPQFTVAIADGASSTRTTSNNVRVSITDANRASDVAEMCISAVSGTTAPSSCSNFVAFNASSTVELPSGDGVKTVGVFLKTTGGTVSRAAVTDAITLDATAPTNGAGNISVGDGSLALSWSRFSDAGTGLASYTVVVAEGATAPADCSSGSPVFSGIATSFTDSSLTNNIQRSYRICAVDGAGNISSGVVVSATPNPPLVTGTVAIKDGLTATSRTSVPLVLSGSSNRATVTQMCISETDVCTRFVAYRTSSNFTVSREAGLKTIRVIFKDRDGRLSEAATTQITLDNVAPVNGTITGTLNSSANGVSVQLAWSGFSDANTSIAKYRVVSSLVRAPVNCRSGTLVYEGTDLTAVQNNVQRNKTVGYRVCAIDAAGNTSTGATVSVVVPAQ